jgi:hypothetical protein
MTALDDRVTSGVKAVDAVNRSPMTRESTGTIPRRALRRIVFVGLIGAATLTMQQWLGDVTIYQPVNRERAEILHRSILANSPPAGLAWDSLGANGTNIRVGAVFLAEGVHRVVGLSVARTYLLLDTIFLAIGLLLFARFLATWFRDEYVLLGTLYFIVVLPLTYFLVSYHPWDRLALVFWMILLLALRSERVLLFALLLPLSVAIKYDAVLLPGLYFLANVRPATWRRTTLTTLGLFVLSFGTFFGLILLRPGGFASHSIVQQIALNFAEMREFLLWYPPLLAFGVPLLLAGIGFRHADRFMRACAIAGVLLFVPLFLQAVFAEFRAQVPMLILLMPCALRGAEVLLAPDSLTRGTAAS